MTIISSFVTGISIYTATKEVVKDVGELFPESIPPALEKACVTSSASEVKYLKRPDVEAKTNKFLDRVYQLMRYIWRKRSGEI